MTKPSWQDYGTYDESEHARLWDGVVGAWCPSLGPTGSRLFDHSRFSNWGTLTNMDNATDWVVSGGQYALDFDGTNDHVAIASNVFSGLSVVTVSLWVKPRTTADRIEIVQGADNLNRTGYGFAEDGNAYVVPNFAGQVNNFGYSNWSSFGVTNFLHGVFIYNARGGSNAERAKIFINGRQQTLTFVGNIPTTAISQGGTPFIGARPGPATYSNGEFSEAIVWNRELTANEVWDLYLLGRGGMYERRRRSRRRAIEQAAGFRAYWVRQQSRVIGGGV